MQEDGVLSEVFRVVALIHLVPQPLYHYHSHYTPSKPARARPGYQILTNPDSLNFPISGFGKVDADLLPIGVTLAWRNIMSENVLFLSTLNKHYPKLVKAGTFKMFPFS